MEKKNNSLVIILMGVIIVILAVLCILFATGTINLKNNDININNSIKGDNNSNQNISYSVDDYISVEKINIGDEMFSVEKVVFKNLDSSLTQKFNEEQQKILDSVNSTKDYFSKYDRSELKAYYIEGTNFVAKTSIWYQINKNILTVYEEVKQSNEIGTSVDTNILNIDLANNKLMTNKELLESVNYSYRDIATKEYERVIDSCSNLTDRNFCYYDRSEKQITLEQHKNNKETFISNIENKLDDLVKVYIQDGKVKYDYRTIDLRLVNEYLGIGGPFSIETVEVNEYK